MEYEKYNYKKKKKFFGRKILIFFSFLIVLGIIFITSFYKGGSITGNAIESLNQNNSINIKASLLVPEVNLKGDYEEITLSVKEGYFVNLDKKRISLDRFENKLVIKNFEGNIEINENNINKLEGKISEIEINNIPINSQSGGKLKFSISPGAVYNSFEISEGVYLGDVSFTTSGRIEFEGNSLKLTSEKIRFINYLGSLKIEDKKMILQGIVKSLKVDSESRKITLSGN
jgi:hypothetical protein